MSSYARAIQVYKFYDKSVNNKQYLIKFSLGSNKRSGSSLSFSSPPEKKPNIEDVKEYTEAHRMRKALVADEFEDEQDEYVEDQYITDDIHGNQTSESVVIKDEPGNVNHAKIISEVLKKYPHLVKNNKNIKLKIMQRGNQQTITAPMLSPPPPPVATVKAKIEPPGNSAQPKAPKKIDSKTMHALIALGAENVTGPWLCLKCGVNGRPISIPSYKGFRRHLINSHKERIDPLICEHCGQRTSKRAELFHHMLVQHNVKLPLGVRLPKCTDCKYFAIDGMDLKKHRDEEHKKVVSVEKLNTHHCIYCNKTFSNEIRVYEHMRANHRQRACDDGVMDFDEEDMDQEDKYVPNNAEQAGSSNEKKIKIISNITLPSISSIGNASTSAASHHQQNINLEPSSEAEGLSNVASGIATSLGVLDANAHDEYNTSVDDEHSSATQTLSTNYIEEAMANVHGEYIGNVNKKQMSVDQEEYLGEHLHEDEEEEQDVTQFVTAEGSTLELTASQKADLLQQLQDQSGVVMILNDDDYDHNQQIVEHSDQGIMVVYSQQDEVNNSSTVSTCVTTPASTSNGLEVAATSDSQDSMITTEPNWQNEDHNKADAEIKNETEDEMETSMNADEDMDVSKDPLEDDDNTNDDKKNDEKEAAAAATKKLIEGDWSEDDEHDHSGIEPAEDTKTIENPKSISSGFQSSTAKRSYKGSRDPKGATTSNKTDETNKRDLDDLEKASDDLETKNETEELSADTETLAADESNETTTDINADIESTSGTASNSKTLTDKTSSKVEINTLINDWGDDDEDDDEDKD